jgi:hypothetical protein
MKVIKIAEILGCILCPHNRQNIDNDLSHCTKTSTTFPAKDTVGWFPKFCPLPSKGT